MKTILILLLRIIASVPAFIVAICCLILVLMTGNKTFSSGATEVFNILWYPNEDTYDPFY